MTHDYRHVALAVILCAATSAAARGQGSHVAHSGEDPRPQPMPPAPRLFVAGDRVIERDRPPTPILVRPATLAAQIGELAGQTVRVPYSRVVGVYNPRVFVVDTASRLPALPGNRGRVLVFVDPGALRVPDTMIVASTVTVSGVARTLLGMQVTAEVAWPRELRPEVIQRLEIRAAVLAASVQTAEGVELTSRP
jgi:hypothetical protein